MDRRSFLCAGGAFLLSACATQPRGAAESTQVPAPPWRVGDSWTYRRVDGYNSLPRGLLTRQVRAVEPNGLRFVTTDEAGRVHDDALFLAPGIQTFGTLSEDGPVVGAFTPPLTIYDFPLYSGKAWRQQLHRTDANGYRTYMTAGCQVEGWEDVPTPTRNYRAIVVHRQFMLGPKDPFTPPLYRDETEWYVPELRGAAALHSSEWWYYPHIGLFQTEPRDRFVSSLETFQLS
jgi:hypothetical protein